MTDPEERFSGRWLDAYAGMLQPGLQTLDLGCGPGDDSLELTQVGLRVVGLDKRVTMVHEAAERVPVADFVVADMTIGLPFR